MKKHLLLSILFMSVLGLSACTWDDNAHYSNKTMPTDNTETTAGAAQGHNPYNSGGGTGTALGR